MTFVYLRGYCEYISHFLAQVTLENEEIVNRNVSISIHEEISKQMKKNNNFSVLK